MVDFTNISKAQENAFNEQLQYLKQYCEEDKFVEEMVSYIIAFSDEDAYAEKSSDEARLGLDILQHIWEITGISMTGIGNSIHFDLSWVSNLNSFIGNYIYDDSAFKLKPFNRTFEFEPSGSCDAGKDWLQDPRIIIEAAKANREYYNAYDEIGARQAIQKGVKVDQSKVIAILEELGKI